MNPDQNTNPTPSPEAGPPANVPENITPTQTQPGESVSPSPTPAPTVTSPTPTPAPAPVGAPASPVTVPEQQSTGIVSGGPGINPSNNTPTKPAKKKKLIIAGAVTAAVLVLGGVGAYFGLYVPNQPDNVYSTGLDRTGKVVEQLVNEGFEEQKLKSYENSEVTGSVEVAAAGQTFKGTFGSKYDPKRSDSTLTYNAEGSDLNVQLLSELADGKTYPDIFFKVTGLKALGLEEVVPGVDQYEGKWISVPADYLQSLTAMTGTEIEDTKNEFTQQDAAELSKIVTDKTREYVFTNDPGKSVTVQKEFVGTEKLGDITANHYKVGIQKENSKKYCTALGEAILNSNAYKHIPGVDLDTLEEDKKSVKDECNTAIDEGVKDSDSFDMWIDKKLKLIHKIRVTDEQDKGTYLEVGQSYKKGDVIPMFARIHSDEGKYDGEVTLEVNTKESITKGGFTAEYRGEEKVSAKGSFEFKPHNGEVKIDKPKDAVPLEEVLKSFGFDPAEFAAPAAAEEDIESL